MCHRHGTTRQNGNAFLIRGIASSMCTAACLRPAVVAGDPRTITLDALLPGSLRSTFQAVFQAAQRSCAESSGEGRAGECRNFKGHTLEAMLISNKKCAERTLCEQLELTVLFIHVRPLAFYSAQPGMRPRSSLGQPSHCGSCRPWNAQ